MSYLKKSTLITIENVSNEIFKFLSFLIFILFVCAFLGFEVWNAPAQFEFLAVDSEDERFGIWVCVSLLVWMFFAVIGMLAAGKLDFIRRRDYYSKHKKHLPLGCFQYQDVVAEGVYDDVFRSYMRQQSSKNFRTWLIDSGLAIINGDPDYQNRKIITRPIS